MKRIGTLWALAGAGAVVTAGAAAAFDLQEWVAQGVSGHSLQLFGVAQPLPGARFRGWNRFKGMKWDRLCEIVTARPGAEFAYRTIRTTTRPDSTLWRFRLRAVDGGTLLTQSYELSASPLVMLFEKVSRRPVSVPQAMRQTLERLAADLAREPAPVR